MQVKDVETEGTVTESATDSLRRAAERMWRQQTGSLLVTAGGQLIGIITERDVLRAVAHGGDPDRSSVDEVMTADVFTVHPDLAPGRRPGDGRTLDPAPPRGPRRPGPRRGQHA